MKTLEQILQNKIDVQFQKVQMLASQNGFLNPKVVSERKKYELLKSVLDEFEKQSLSIKN